MSGNRHPARGHESFEHTADLGLEVWAESLEGLFEEAALALIETILDRESVQETEYLSVEVEGEEPEELLVEWLEEILFAFEGRDFAPARARVDCLEERRLSGQLSGECLEPDRHQPRRLIKAVTYHDLNIREEDGTLRVRIVLDI